MNGSHLVRGINATDANTATGMIIVIYQVLLQFNNVFDREQNRFLIYVNKAMCPPLLLPWMISFSMLQTEPTEV